MANALLSPRLYAVRCRRNSAPGILESTQSWSNTSL